jgi:hypothetical protein
VAKYDTAAYATGYFSRLSNQPLPASAISEGAQTLEAKDFQWLIAAEARRLAMELYGPRSDCKAWRPVLLKQPDIQDWNYSARPDTPDGQTISPSNSPSEAMRQFDQFLRGARVLTRVEQGRIGFSLMTDDDVLASSRGEVTTHLRHVAERQGSGGLYCGRIFGTPQDWTCGCGRRYLYGRDYACKQCGVQPAGSRERRQWMGHIDLPAAVVHGWFLHGAAAQRLADELDLHVDTLREIADCWAPVVVDPGASPLARGQLLRRDDVYNTYRNGANGVRLAVGGEAIEFLLHQANAAGRTGLPVDGIIIRRIPVLSPELCTTGAQSADYHWGRELNVRYANVLRCVAQVRRYSTFPSFSMLADCSALQASVEYLLDHTRTPNNYHHSIRLLATGAGSIAERLLSAREPAATLREKLQTRSVDFSASARLVTGDTGDVGTVLLPKRIAWTLLEPHLLRQLERSGPTAAGPDIRELIDRRDTQAEAALRAVCDRALVLLLPAQGPWRAVAMRVRLANDQAVHVNSSLLDLIGWENLGQPVRVLSVITDGAIREAASLLTPSRLTEVPSPDAASRLTSNSVFDLPQPELIDKISLAAWEPVTFPLIPEDHLLLCDSEW